MGKRFFALVVALAVVSAPVALEICQITCESKAMEPSVAHHASCHEDGGTSPHVSAAGIPCEHGTDATPSLVAARNSDPAVSLMAVVPVSDSVITVEARPFASVRESAGSDRLAIPLAIPLRV